MLGEGEGPFINYVTHKEGKGFVAACCVRHGGGGVSPCVTIHINQREAPSYRGVLAIFLEC